MNATEFNDSQFNILLKEIKSLKAELEKTIVDEAEKHKQELKDIIHASEEKLMSRIEDLNKRVSELEQENRSLNHQLESLEREQRKKNILVFGLEESTENITPFFVSQELSKLLDIQIHPEEINNSFHIGRSDSKIIKIEFNSQIVKRNVLQNSRKLKGTKISIVQDLTRTQQKVNKILRQHLAIVRKNSTKKSFIKGDKLYIDNIGYSVDELEKRSISTFVEANNEIEQIVITPKASESEKNKKEQATIQERRNRREGPVAKKEEGTNKAQFLNTQSYKTRAHSHKPIKT